MLYNIYGNLLWKNKNLFIYFLNYYFNLYKQFKLKIRMNSHCMFMVVKQLNSLILMMNMLCISTILKWLQSRDGRYGLKNISRYFWYLLQ